MFGRGGFQLHKCWRGLPIQAISQPAAIKASRDEIGINDVRMRSASGGRKDMEANNVQS